MKQIISILFLGLHFLNSTGQINFKADPKNLQSRYKVLLTQKIDSAFNVSNKFDFEFRLWTHESLSLSTNVFIMSKVKNVWAARFFEFDGYLNKFSEIKTDQSKLNILWNKLVKNKILSLPTQNSLKPSMRIFPTDTASALNEAGSRPDYGMSDGTTFSFELRTQTKMRTYEFYDPQEYLKKYPNIEELYHAFVIIVTIRKYLGLSLTNY